MKLLHLFSLLLILHINSCQSQEKNTSIILHYQAQTRGFLYEINLENNSLQIHKNAEFKKTTLSENELENIYTYLNSINFKKIKSNSLKEELAVDKSIEGTFYLKFQKKSYSFTFDHLKLPIEINQLFNQLEGYLQ